LLSAHPFEFVILNLRRVIKKKNYIYTFIYKMR